MSAIGARRFWTDAAENDGLDTERFSQCSHGRTLSEVLIRSLDPKSCGAPSGHDLLAEALTGIMPDSQERGVSNPPPLILDLL